MKAAPRTATRASRTLPPTTSRASSTIRPAPPQVDGVDLAQERQGLVDPELAGARHEGADVLGQAAAAETEARVEESAADPFVVRQGRGEHRDVGAGRLAHLGHGVDERDLGCQEGVRGHLDELGRRVVHDHERDAGRRVAVGRPRARPSRPDRVAGSSPARAGPARGCPRSQSPRAGTRGSRRARRRLRRAHGLAAARRAGPPSRSAPSTCRRRPPARRGAGRGRPPRRRGGDVGGVLARQLRGPDADEVQVGERGCLGVGGREAKTSGGQPALQELFEAGFVHRGTTGGQRLDGGGVRRPCPARRSRARPCRRRGSCRGSRSRGR